MEKKFKDFGGAEMTISACEVGVEIMFSEAMVLFDDPEKVQEIIDTLIKAKQLLES